jgi:hypothetical protein
MNINQLNQNIELQTKLSIEKRRSLVNWFNKQNVEIQLLVFNEQKNQYFKLKSTIEDQNIVSICAYYLAIAEFYNKEIVMNKKNKSQSLDNISKHLNLEIKKAKKLRKKEKREKLLNLISVVERLKDDGYSLRNISKYLAAKHRFNVSHVYIANFIKEFELCMK